MRCGVIAVTSKYRGTDLATRLMEEHIKLGKQNGCKQYMLEVLANNKRAISFYNKFDYEKVYDLTYRKIDGEKLKRFSAKELPKDFIVRKITLKEAASIKEYDCNHVIWRNDFDFLSKIETFSYGVYNQNKLVGAIVASKRKIDYLFVSPEFRYRYIAMNLLCKALSGDIVEKPIFSYTNNSVLHLFANHIGMEKTENNHIIMYKSI